MTKELKQEKGKEKKKKKVLFWLQFASVMWEI